MHYRYAIKDAEFIQGAVCLLCPKTWAGCCKTFPERLINIYAALKAGQIVTR